MEIKRVLAFYFSATGTTEKVAGTLAETAGGLLCAPVEATNFAYLGVRREPAVFGAGDLVFFSLPVYAGRVPNVLLPYLREQVMGGGALAVPVVLYGNRNYDDALVELRDLLEAAGFHTLAGAAFVGEHSFSQVLAAGRPDGKDMEIVRSFAGQVAEKARRLPAAPDAPIAVRGENPIRPYYTPRDRNGAPINILKVRPKTGDSCIRCGLCSRICPMGSIDPENPAGWRGKGICIKCCACVKRCPVGAKYFDDPGFLYHARELEAMYTRRAEPELFL